MKTEVIDTRKNPENGTQLGGKILRSGGLVAFPTETVYGLGANGLDGNAVRKIFEAKGRPNDNPLILHVSKKSDVRQLWDTVPETAQKLMDTFWPGPLTIIYTKSDIVQDEVTAGLDTVAVRMPLNETARYLIKNAGVPVAAPSANLSGKPSPTCAEHVLKDMDGKIPLILNGGTCKYGVESTVVSIVGTPVILRPGAITREMLSSCIGEVRISNAILNPLGENETAASPGMKYKHYSPDADVIVINGNPYACAEKINEMYLDAELAGKTVMIAATEQTKRFYNNLNYVILGDRNEPISMCRNLFAKLREMDETADLILAEGIPAEDEGLAYMNRLLRSAGFEVIEV